MGIMVSAAATIVQATGAIGAIVYSVKLAHASEARIIASEKASVAREETARKESAAREAAAYLAAATRYTEEKTSRDLTAIIPCEEALKHAVLKCSAMIVGYEKMKPGDLGYNATHQGRFESKEIDALLRDIPNLATHTLSPNLIAWMRRLPLRFEDIFRSAQWIETRASLIVKLQNAKVNFEGLLAEASHCRLLPDERKPPHP